MNQEIQKNDPEIQKDGAPEDKPTDLDGAFRMIAELAKNAAGGDKFAGTLLGILKDQQLAKNESLRFEAEALRGQAIVRAAANIASATVKMGAEEC